MNLRTGTRLLVPGQKRSGDFRAFLEEVRSHYWGWHVALLLDGDPSHTAKASLREAEGMTLLWLPNRSPKLNPMDTLWGQGKDVISANKQYETIEEQVDRFLDHLHGLTNQEGGAYVRVPLQEVLAQRRVVKLILPGCLGDYDDPRAASASRYPIPYPSRPAKRPAWTKHETYWLACSLASAMTPGWPGPTATD